MSGGGHAVGGGHLELVFSSVSSLQHQSRGFAAAFQFVDGSYVSECELQQNISQLYFRIQTSPIIIAFLKIRSQWIVHVKYAAFHKAS